MVWRTNERLTRGNEIPKKSCRPLQGSGELQERGVPFSVGERGLEEEGGRKIGDSRAGELREGSEEKQGMFLERGFFRRDVPGERIFWRELPGGNFWEGARESREIFWDGGIFWGHYFFSFAGKEAFQVWTMFIIFFHLVSGYHCLFCA